MVTELKTINQNYDFYITEAISETLYANLKKEVCTQIREIENNKENNEKWYRNNDIDSSLIPIVKPTFNFHLSTYGGSVHNGLGICDLLKSLDNNPDYNVKMICEGPCMSMGIPILVSVKNRVCSPHSSFMIHQIMSLSIGKLETLKEDVKEVERLCKIVDDIILTNTKITESQLNEWYKYRKDYFFDSTEALKLGVVTNIEF